MGKSHLEETLAWQLDAAGFTGYVREYRFAAQPPYKRQFRADFAYIDQHLLIEVEGGTYSRGRHTRPQGFEADCEKYNLAVICGWRVLRFTGKMVNDGRALDTIERVLKCC
jgi:very-short-patch-repair endonuclease